MSIKPKPYHLNMYTMPNVNMYNLEINNYNTQYVQYPNVQNADVSSS